VKVLSLIFVALLLSASGLFAQPTVTQVSNAASFALTPLQNSSIAQGSYFAVFGSGLGPSTGVYWNPYPLPTTLGGSSINVTIGSTTVAAFLEYSSAGQINAVLPANTPTGTGTVTVTYNGQTSSSTVPAAAITVVTSSFGTFAYNAAGTGPGIVTDTNYVELTPFHTAKPGDYVLLYGTGLGVVPGDATSTETDRPPVTNLCPGSQCPTVWVGSQQANIYYAGSATYTAEDEIIFQVPAGAQGCYVQVAVQTGSVISNFTSIAVDPNGATCQDADGINYNDIASAVSTKGSANVMAVSLLSNYLTLDLGVLGSQPWDNDTASGQVDTFSPYVLQAFEGFTLSPSVGYCTVLPFLQYPPPSDPAAGYATFIDDGTSITIKGPNGTANVGQDVPTGASKAVGYGGTSGGDPIGGETIQELISGCPPSSTNNCAPFFLSTSDAITAGTYNISTAGGSGAGAVTGSISVSSGAAAFKWTNSSIASSNIPRNTPLTINWTGGDPSGFVNITLVSSTLLTGATPLATTPGIFAECMAPASAGTFTVPTVVLQSLPSTAASTALVPPGELLVGPASGATKLSTTTGLDAAYAFYHFIQGSNVTWQ